MTPDIVLSHRLSCTAERGGLIREYTIQVEVIEQDPLDGRLLVATDCGVIAGSMRKVEMIHADGQVVSRRPDQVPVFTVQPTRYKLSSS